MMDSPLAPAEFSRLRKAIQQRDRQLTQGFSTTGADSNISRALSNLRLYLPSQTQFATVLKDWESSDSIKRSQIIIWIQQNLLGTPPSPPQNVPSKPPEGTSRPKFIAPPPPPALPSRASTSAALPEHHVTPAGQDVSTPVLTPVTKASHARTNSMPTTATRQLFTRAAPTPPPKDGFAKSRNPSSLSRRLSIQAPHTIHPSYLPQLDSPTDGTLPGPPRSPGQARRSTHHRNQSAAVNSAQPDTTSTLSHSDPIRTADSSQRLDLPTTPGIPVNQPAPNPVVTPNQSLSNQPDPTTQLLALITETSRQRQNNVLAYLASIQGSGSSTTQSTQPNLLYGQINPNQQWVELMAKIQAQQAQQNTSFVQQLIQQSNHSAQTLAAAQQSQPAQTNQILSLLQQSQQAQTNQILSMLQQNQQNTPAFDPSQSLAQSQQQASDILMQLQANTARTPGGMDWANLASGSGIDTNALMTMIGDGTDPTSALAQSVGFLLGS